MNGARAEDSAKIIRMERKIRKTIIGPSHQRLEVLRKDQNSPINLSLPTALIKLIYPSGWYLQRLFFTLLIMKRAIPAHLLAIGAIDYYHSKSGKFNYQIKETPMKIIKNSVFFVFALSILPIGLLALPTLDGKQLGFYPITNEISFYQNVDDPGRNRGRTLQIVSINTLKLITRFNFEVAADINWGFSYLPRDHYMELSVVKTIIPRFSFNYQRIISSFESSPVNQFGLRISF